MRYYIKSGIWDFKKRGSPGELDLSKLVNSPGNYITIDSIQTLTPNFGGYEGYEITGQSEALTIAAPIGSISNWDVKIIRIKDNGIARSITFDPVFRAFSSALPTTTTAGKTLYICSIWNATDSKWDTVNHLEV